MTTTNLPCQLRHSFLIVCLKDENAVALAEVKRFDDDLVVFRDETPHLLQRNLPGVKPSPMDKVLKACVELPLIEKKVPDFLGGVAV